VKPRHVALAVLVAVIWGVAFVMTRLALDAFSPPQLTALRFAIAGLPVLFVPRPRVSWRSLIAVGLTLFTGQFLFQFFGIAHGMPPGLAAVVVQTQAFFTILFAALALSERPSGGQLAGMGMALVVWLSLVPVLPSLALSAWVDGAAAVAPIGPQTTWIGLGAALYLGVVATVIGYAIWGDLLRRYPTPAVAPFALLAPFVAGLGSSLAFGERFGAPRLVGMALVLLGLAVIVLPGSARLLNKA
jgi:O-acetylserine/cysteine efflux transporter